MSPAYDTAPSCSNVLSCGMHAARTSATATDVDAWNQPFLISCEQGPRITLVVTSVGKDGVLGTADDIRRYAEAIVDGGTPIETPHDASNQQFCLPRGVRI